jgi:hypothetical protein
LFHSVVSHKLRQTSRIGIIVLHLKTSIASHSKIYFASLIAYQKDQRQVP